MNVELYPLERIVIDGNSIYFGMERNAVKKIMGEGQLVGTREYYLNNEMAIDYRDNKVEYMEFLGGTDGKLNPVIFGVSVFDSDSEMLLAVLKKENNGIFCDRERGYSYQFLNISVGVYREAVPEEVAELVKEAAENGKPLSSEEIAYEMKRANRFSTVGIGVEGYFKSL